MVTLIWCRLNYPPTISCSFWSWWNACYFKLVICKRSGQNSVANFKLKFVWNLINSYQISLSVFIYSYRSKFYSNWLTVDWVTSFWMLMKSLDFKVSNHSVVLQIGGTGVNLMVPSLDSYFSIPKVLITYLHLYFLSMTL